MFKGLSLVNLGQEHLR